MDLEERRKQIEKHLTPEEIDRLIIASDLAKQRIAEKYEKKQIEDEEPILTDFILRRMKAEGDFLKALERSRKKEENN